MFDAALKAGASGATSGGIMGLGGSLLSGAPPKQALRNALMAALAGGTISGVGVGAGTAFLGEPKDEVNPYTRRGSVGGAGVGGTMGALLGAALAKKYLKAPSKLQNVEKFFVGKHPALGALIGGAGGAAFGAYQGADEGMQLDALQGELDDLELRRRRNAR